MVLLHNNNYYQVKKIKGFVCATLVLSLINELIITKTPLDKYHYSCWFTEWKSMGQRRNVHTVIHRTE